MDLSSIQRLFKRNQPLLVIFIHGRELRYLMRVGKELIKVGRLALPEKVALDGRLLDPRALESIILPNLPFNSSCNMSVILPSRLSYIEYLELPRGLDVEELDYQVSKHITGQLGLNINDVYYDWTYVDQNPNADKSSRNELIMIVVARQTDILPYGEIFDQTHFNVKYVAAEQQVIQLLEQTDFPTGQSIVCQVEYGELQLWKTDVTGKVQYFHKRFDVDKISQAGFVYQTHDSDQSSIRGGSNLKLPPHWLVDEMLVSFDVWLGDYTNEVTEVIVLGEGVDWQAAILLLKERLGVPVRFPTLRGYSENEASHELETMSHVYGPLWQFSNGMNS